jgi:hypothetical protein
MSEHGIHSAVYERAATGLQPTLFCLCGFAAQGDTWEEAGAELDAHLDEEPDEAIEIEVRST